MALAGGFRSDAGTPIVSRAREIGKSHLVDRRPRVMARRGICWDSREFRKPSGVRRHLTETASGQNTRATILSAPAPCAKDAARVAGPERYRLPGTDSA